MSITMICIYLIIGLIIYLVINYRYLKYSTKYKNDVWVIPGPRILPLVGTKWIFYWKYKLKKLHEVYEDFFKQYGPIVLEVTPGGIPIVNLFDRKDIEIVLLNNKTKYPFRPPTEIVSVYRKSRPDRYASVGLTNEQGENWHMLRTKLTPHLTTTKMLNAFVPTLNGICDEFIQLIKNKRNSLNVIENFPDIANLMGLEVICALMLDKRIGFLSLTPPDEVKQLITAVKQIFISQRDSYYGSGLWKYLPTKLYRNYRKSEEIIYNVVSDIMEKAMAQDSHNDTENSIFWSILKVEDLDIREKKSAIIDFISAGIETFANTLIFSLYYVSQDQLTVDKIRSDFIYSSQSIDVNELTTAYYTKDCIEEVYRLCPTAMCLARIIEKNTELSGYNVNAGTVVLCHTRIACQDERNFKDAKVFNPNRRRLQNESERSRSNNIILPFGIGKRACPGRRFVEIELLLVLAKLVREFNIEFPSGLELDFEFLIIPKQPVNIAFRDK